MIDRLNNLWSYCAPMNGEILIAIHGKDRP